MGRPCRELKKGATYKVIAKVNRDNLELKDKEIKELFLITVKRAKKRYAFLIKNFLILHNCAYIFIEPLGDESLSSIMQWILSVFTKHYNKRHNIKGHLWRARFISEIIKGMRDYIDKREEINKLPVSLQLVAKAEDFEYSGLYHRIKKIYTVIEKSKDRIALKLKYKI